MNRAPLLILMILALVVSCVIRNIQAAREIGELRARVQILEEKIERAEGGEK